MMIDCGQVCTYHTLYGCTAKKHGKNCPLSNLVVETAKRRQTNADRIRNMSDDELAWLLLEYRIDAYAHSGGDEGALPRTKNSILEWLQQPYEGE